MSQTKPPASASFLETLNIARAQKSKSLILLGASGSVGQSAYEFLRRLESESKTDRGVKQAVRAKNDLEKSKPQTGIFLSAFSVHSSLSCIHKILKETQVPFVAITDETSYQSSIEDLRKNYPKTNFFGGQSGLLDMIEAASKDGADTVLTAVVGAVGIEATMLCLRLGLKIALANKETLVTAGPAIHALLNTLRKKGIRPAILPVDSEHNAIFQLLTGLPEGHLDRILLTASGGPFRELPIEKLSRVNKQEVLNHPTWSMGPKITVDSAGMINKGLELIEAHFLFGLPYEKIDVRIHPDSIVHSMVATKDGGYLLVASHPHMVFPIAHALFYPEPVLSAHPFSRPPEEWPPITFSKVNEQRYPGFALAVEAGKRGGTAPAIFNAANEEAVSAFLLGRIHFIQISALIQKALDTLQIEEGTDLELFLRADAKAREFVRRSLS